MTDHDQRDATTILTEDHVRVELLFTRYEQLPARRRWMSAGSSFGSSCASSRSTR